MDSLFLTFTKQGKYALILYIVELWMFWWRNTGNCNEEKVGNISIYILLSRLNEKDFDQNVRYASFATFPLYLLLSYYLASLINKLCRLPSQHNKTQCYSDKND